MGEHVVTHATAEERAQEPTADLGSQLSTRSVIRLMRWTTGASLQIGNVFRSAVSQLRRPEDIERGFSAILDFADRAAVIGGAENRNRIQSLDPNELLSSSSVSTSTAMVAPNSDWPAPKPICCCCIKKAWWELPPDNPNGVPGRLPRAHPLSTRSTIALRVALEFTGFYPPCNCDIEVFEFCTENIGGNNQGISIPAFTPANVTRQFPDSPAVVAAKNAFNNYMESGCARSRETYGAPAIPAPALALIDNPGFDNRELFSGGNATWILVQLVVLKSCKAESCGCKPKVWYMWFVQLIVTQGGVLQPGSRIWHGGSMQ